MNSKIKKLENIIGKKALRSLRERRAVLKIWRGTSPFNWFVENAQMFKGYLWHSIEGEKKPNLNLFEEVPSGYDEIIKTGFSWVQGEGNPYLSSYALKEEYLLKEGLKRCQKK